LIHAAAAGHGDIAAAAGQVADQGAGIGDYAPIADAEVAAAVAVADRQAIAGGEVGIVDRERTARASDVTQMHDRGSGIGTTADGEPSGAASGTGAGVTAHGEVARRQRRTGAADIDAAVGVSWRPITVLALLTLAPPLMVRLPLLTVPTKSEPVLVQRLPTPLILTVDSVLPAVPITPVTESTVEPPVMERLRCRHCRP
jgi:hypothetical protein